MAQGLNRVTLLGNIGSDPEMRMLSTGVAVLKLRLATNESFKDKNGVRQERTEWHQVTIWGKRAEGLARILAKGRQLCVEGRIRSSSYEDRDGVKRYRTEIVASNVVLCGSRSDGAPSSARDAPDEPEVIYEEEDDDIPF